MTACSGVLFEAMQMYVQRQYEDCAELLANHMKPEDGTAAVHDERGCHDACVTLFLIAAEQVYSPEVYQYFKSVLLTAASPDDDADYDDDSGSGDDDSDDGSDYDSGSAW